MITTICHVTVTIPRAVYDHFDGDASFESDFQKAVTDADEAGVNLYDREPEMYASFNPGLHQLEQAQACESALNELVSEYTRRFNDYVSVNSYDV